MRGTGCGWEGEGVERGGSGSRFRSENVIH